MLLHINVYQTFAKTCVSAFLLKTLVFVQEVVVTDEIHGWAKGHTGLLGITKTYIVQKKAIPCCTPLLLQEINYLYINSKFSLQFMTNTVQNLQD